MSGNSWGKLFCLSSFGESHGPALGAIVDGCPPGLSLTEADIQRDLDRRRPGQSHYVTQRQERDQVEILSGVYEGQTTGMPIAMLFRNQDAKSGDYQAIRDKFRPGHADYTWFVKYRTRDHRGGGRSSARETIARVAAGAVARCFLRQKGIEVRGCVSAIGKVRAQEKLWDQVSKNPFNWPGEQQINQLEQLIKDTRRAGDSVGAEVLVEASGVPVGLGEPVFDRLDADIAKAMMSINAVKAVAVGDGFDVVQQRGSDHRDEMTVDGFTSNHAGGVLGGLSTGQPIVVRLAVKPTSSINRPGKTIDVNRQACEIITTGRHDPCVGIRAVPIAEAMLLLVLIDHWLRDAALQAGNLLPRPAAFNET